MLFHDDSEGYTSVSDAVDRGPWSRFDQSGGTVSLSKNYAHSGTQSFRVCYPGDETQAYMGIDLGAGERHLFLRWWELRERAGDFEGAKDYDWGAEKLNRLRSRVIESTGVDYPLGWGSAGHDVFGSPGLNEPGSIDLFGNSVASYQEDGGYVTSADGNIPRGEWHMFEVELDLGTPGQPDGLARIWIDDVLEAETLNIGLLPRGEARIEEIWMGGWFSGGHDPEPSPACRYFDDVVVARSKIGFSEPSS